MTDSPRTAADVLRAARAKIDTPKKWTQGVMGRDHAYPEVTHTY